MNTTFLFNKIYFLESINTNIPKDKPLAIGDSLITELKEQINLLKAKDAKYEDLSCELIKIDGFDQWNNAVEKIVQECKNGVYPIIHFICHGYYNEKTKISFMCLSDGESDAGYSPIQWPQVTEALEKINMECHNNLMVTMCVCYGFYALTNLLNDKHRIPYWCLLSKPERVSLKEGKDILEFYLALIQNFDLNKALNLLHNISYNGLTENKDKLNFTFSDFMFSKCMQQAMKNNENNEFIREQALKTYYSSIAQFIIKPLDYQKLFVDEFHKNRDVTYRNIMNYKFMFDLYPEERSRFNLPNSYEELMAWDINKYFE